jgi:hypothetical protein
MAQFTRVNGDFYPVLNLDVFSYSNPGVNAVSANVAVQPQGPKLDFLTISAGSGNSFSSTQANVIFDTIQQLATVYIYEYTNPGTDAISFAVYPAGAWSNVDPSGGSLTPANLVSAVNTALTSASLTAGCSGTRTATFTTPTGE